MMSQESDQLGSKRPPAPTAAPNVPVPSSSGRVGDAPRRRARRSVRYPNAYVWFVFLAALDVVLTYLILHPVLFFRDPGMTESRGAEANALANWIIERWDVPGMVVFKFLLVLLVVVLCEIIGRYKEQTGRRIAEWAVAITAIPVILALIQMGLDLYFWFQPPH
jgi:hypothetical protein